MHPVKTTLDAASGLIAVRHAALQYGLMDNLFLDFQLVVRTLHGCINCRLIDPVARQSRKELLRTGRGHTLFHVKQYGQITHPLPGLYRGVDLFGEVRQI